MTRPRHLPPRPVRDGVYLNSCLSRGRTSCGKYTPTVFLQARETAVIPSGSPPPPRYPGAGPAHPGLHARGELAAGFDINTATAWRYLTGTVALLAARAPKPSLALAATWDAGHAYPVIDGP